MVYKVVVLVVCTLRGAITVPVKDRANATSEDQSAIKLRARTFLTDPSDLWPRTTDKLGNTLVIVPYVFHNLEPLMQELVEIYMQEFANKSCIRYVPATGREDVKLLFTSETELDPNKPEACSAYVGYNVVKRVIYLRTARCLGDGSYEPNWFNVPHEMMHSLGFIHEQSRRDRDCYVIVDEPLKQVYNEIYTFQNTDVTFPYDTKSVMQYPGGNEMRSKFGETLGPEGNSLDAQDWMRLNYVYCGGPHICQVDPGLCERHRKIRLEGGCVTE